MLLGKMEIMSRVEPFDRVLTFLEVIADGLHGFSCYTSRRFTDFDTSVSNLPCVYTLFLLLSIVRYDHDFKGLSIGPPGTKTDIYIFLANILLYCILSYDAGPSYSG